jgi:hypothetical protein
MLRWREVVGSRRAVEALMLPFYWTIRLVLWIIEVDIAIVIACRDVQSTILLSSLDVVEASKTSPKIPGQAPTLPKFFR